MLCGSFIVTCLLLGVCIVLGRAFLSIIESGRFGSDKLIEAGESLFESKLISLFCLTVKGKSDPDKWT